MPRTGGVEEQPRSFDCIPGYNYRPGSLEMLLAVAVDIDNAISPAIVAQADARSHRMRANLRAMSDGIGHMGDQRACFRTDLAALQAKTAIDAMWTISMRSGKDRNGSSRNRANPKAGASTNQNITDSAKRMRSIRMSVWIAPRKPGRSGNRNLPLQQFVIRFEIPIRDRPIDADAVFRVHPKVRGMKTRGESCPVDGASADSLTAVVRAQGEWICAAGDTQIVPVEFVRSLLVADPVFLRIPERTGLQGDNAKSRARQSLRKYSAGGANADDAVIDRFAVGKPSHRRRKRLHGPKTMRHQ